jgi:hypothetical protein
MACGSGACASPSRERGRARAGDDVVRFPGGALEVERLESGEVLLTGDVERVFEARSICDRLRAASAVSAAATDEIDSGADERLAAATLRLVNIASVSGDETEVLLDAIAAALPRASTSSTEDRSCSRPVDASDARRSSCWPATWTPCRTTATSRNAWTTPSSGRGAADMKGASR